MRLVLTKQICLNIIFVRIRVVKHFIYYNKDRVWRRLSLRIDANQLVHWHRIIQHALVDLYREQWKHRLLALLKLVSHRRIKIFQLTLIKQIAQKKRRLSKLKSVNQLKRHHLLTMTLKSYLINKVDGVRGQKIMVREQVAT